MKKKENTLTKVEFQVMSILWDINHSACAWDIIERWEEPKPAYTTIATYLKMLYERGYVDFFKNKGEGKTHMYVAKIGRAEYTRKLRWQRQVDVEFLCEGGKPHGKGHSGAAATHRRGRGKWRV